MNVSSFAAFAQPNSFAAFGAVASLSTPSFGNPGCGGLGDGFCGSPEFSQNCHQGAFGNGLMNGLADSFGGGCNGGQNSGQGGVIELHEGETYTTPGGTTINFAGGKKGKVDIDESGQGSGCQGQAQGGEFAVAGERSGFDQNGRPYTEAFAAAGATGGPGCQPSTPGQPRHTEVYGDPHVKYGDGKKEDFKEKNAEFDCQDGTRVVCQAPGKKDKVKRVTVFLPGSQASLGSAGIDANKTSLMKGEGGHFTNVGRVGGSASPLELPPANRGKVSQQTVQV